MRSISEKRTPEKWLELFNQYVIVDNDGWTDEEWREQEPLTYFEFMKRFIQCTVRPRGC